jgi:hypothetical protein
MSIPRHLLQDQAGSQQHSTQGGQFWTPIPRLRGSKLHAETQLKDLDRHHCIPRRFNNTDLVASHRAQQFHAADQIEAST